MRLLLLFSGLLVIPLCWGEETLPSITYPDTRVSKKWINVHGVNHAVDDGIEWQGIKVYLSDSMLIGVDAKDGTTAVWNAETSAFWNSLKIVEMVVAGQKIWAVEMRARADDDPVGKTVEYHELKTGKKIPVTDPPPSGVSLLPVRSPGTNCSVALPFFALVTTQANFEKVWKRLNGPTDPIIREELDEPSSPSPGTGLLERERKPPAVDFGKEVVLVFCMGDGANCSGITAEECYEDAARILLRTKQHGFQTMGGWVFRRDCALFVLPRREDKAYILEHDTQRYIRGAAVWTEQFKVAKLGDPTRELDKLLPIPQPKMVAADFKPEVKHFKSPEQDEGGFGGWRGSYEYDYYLDADGKPIRHGPYRKYQIRNGKEKTEFKGEYQHGEKQGLWTYYVRRIYEWDDTTPNFTATYENGKLHGPMQDFNTKGKLSVSGQFEHGKAHGVWSRYFENGTKSYERTFDHGLLEGVARTWNQDGKLLTEANYLHGQYHGRFTRWYPNGKIALSGELVAGDEPPALIDATGSQLYYMSNAIRGFRQGEWVYYAQDGKELWRGNFDKGTGTWVEFTPEGQKILEAQLVNGVIDGEYRTWTQQGALEKLDTLKPNEMSYRSTYHANGVKESETQWLRGIQDGMQRHWDVDGKLEAEGEWRNGKPWSGACVLGSLIHTYIDGKEVEEKRAHWTRKVAEEVAERSRKEKEARQQKK